MPTEPFLPEEPPTARAWDFDWLPIYFVSLLLVALLLVTAAVGQQEHGSDPAPGAARSGAEVAPGSLGPVTGNNLPGGASRIFADDRILVAYAGTAGTGSLGVLGEGTPDEVMPQLNKAAAGFGQTGRPVQPVFELVATVAHAGPTDSGRYSSDLDRATVQRYIDAAHRYGALLVLSLQPGRAGFLEVAQRWEWALKDPLVGLALEPEWRMGPTGIPGQEIGSVAAAEVNEVSRWLEDLTAAQRLPEKLFAVHQFREDMVRDLAQVEPRPHLAMVQHLDGFGSPKAKLAAFAELARPARFTLGLTLFGDEDTPRLQPSQVLAIKPRVSYVSFR